MNDLLIFLKSGYESKNLIIFFGAFFHEVIYFFILGKYQSKIYYIKLILELMDMGSLRDIFNLVKKQKIQKNESLISENILS